MDNTKMNADWGWQVDENPNKIKSVTMHAKKANGGVEV